jgi:hypothetical protein
MDLHARPNVRAPSPRACTGFLMSAYCVGFVVVANIVATAAARAETLLFHATDAGKQTLDQDDRGGNPFASSLIEVLTQPQVKLSELPGALRKLTIEKSKGFQSPEVPLQDLREDWSLSPPAPNEIRIALVLVVSDYAKSGGAQSLAGASHDGQRIVAALQRAGFAAELALDLELPAMREKLAAFAAQSKRTDAAIIYTTGHGVEVGREIFLLPGDYPISRRNSALTTHAIRLSDIVLAAQAKHMNLIFYGGCRDNPLGH